MYLDIHLQGGVYLIYTPPIEQSDWLECYNHGTIINPSFLPFIYGMTKPPF